MTGPKIKRTLQLRYRERVDRDIVKMLRVATGEEGVEVLVEALKEAPEIPALEPEQTGSPSSTPR